MAIPEPCCPAASRNGAHLDLPASDILEALRTRIKHGEDAMTTVGADVLSDETFEILAALFVNAERL
ncbi:hypothetical protein [Actinomadura litoris]|uniref:hypothetical protein n=1 Tax=Actinomadura litoris TaxID=2678616 RepID=UPI001FA7CB0A|nr:hypothetical protein [Actinomadura litoris]